MNWLQQHLPFTVLKLIISISLKRSLKRVATALTVYGIETSINQMNIPVICVATALTVYGIETVPALEASNPKMKVATALTVYGIETVKVNFVIPISICVATALTVYGIETQYTLLYSYLY